MQARMNNPRMRRARTRMEALSALGKAADAAGVAAADRSSSSTCAPARSTAAACASTCTRASCSKAGETDERLFAVAAWRDAPYFTDAERAALALTEALTRLADRADPVPDDVWDEAARHYDEQELAAIVLMIAMTNFFNRINVTVREPAGTTWG